MTDLPHRAVALTAETSCRSCHTPCENVTRPRRHPAARVAVMKAERTVVCMSGVGGSAAEWDLVSPSLARFGQVSTAPPAAGPLIVVGHSQGGVRALQMAAGEPGRVEAVVLASSFFPPARAGRPLAAAAVDYGRHRIAYARELAGRRRVPSPTRRGLRQMAAVARLGLRRRRFTYWPPAPAARCSWYTGTRTTWSRSASSGRPSSSTRPGRYGSYPAPGTGRTGITPICGRTQSRRGCAAWRDHYGAGGASSRWSDVTPGTSRNRLRELLVVALADRASRALRDSLVEPSRSYTGPKTDTS